MFKGTNKVWKGLALALALCMLPTVAFATQTENSVDIAASRLDNGNVKVTVTICDKNTPTEVKADTDVTILALRRVEGESEVTTIPAVAETLKKQVTYIDQETSDENGEVTFEFIPASTDAAYSSKYIDIYVGGADVAAPQVATVECPLAAPTPKLAANYKWMAGDDIVLTLEGSITSGDTAAADLAAWAENVEANITVEGESVPIVEDEVETWALDATEKTLEIPNTLVARKTITGITFTSGRYAEKSVEIPGGGLAENLKTIGTATLRGVVVDKDYVVATLTVADEEDEGWAVASAAGLFVDGVAIAETAATATLTGSTLEVKLPPLGIETLTKTYVLTIAVDNFDNAKFAPINVVANAPTVAAKAELEKTENAPKASYVTEGTDDDKYYTGIPENDGAAYDPTLEEVEKQQMWGKRELVLPMVETVTGANVSWTVTKVGGDAVEGAEADGEMTFALERSWYDSITYTVVGTATMEGFKEAVTKEFTVTTAQLGVAGVDVSITLPKELSVAGTTVNLVQDAESMALTAGAPTGAGEVTFIISGVNVGNYKLVINRPGYKVKEIDVVVGQESVVVPAPTDMVFGNITGPSGVLDEVVNFRDYDALLLVLGDPAKYDVMYDYNADDLVNFRDYDELLLNLD